MHDFGVSQTKAVLGLSLYVMGYGIGPMFLTPLQEMPVLGRNPVYILGLAVFLLFNVPIVEAKNFSTILVFRFFTGFMASPALATGVCVSLTLTCDNSGILIYFNPGRIYERYLLL